MQPSEKKIIVTGGGTGGHVFPAIAICEEMKSRGYAVTYVGTKAGMEAKLVPPTGIEFVTLQSGGIKNKGWITSLLALFRVARSTLWAVGYLRKQRPAAVVGVGGYVSVPISVAAYLLRIPLFLQEQNSSVGIANRFLGKLARQIYLGFPEAAAYFPRDKCRVTGNPLRQEFRSLRPSPVPFDPPTLLVFGGSQGAKAINEAVLQALPKLQQQCPDVRIIHQTGNQDWAATKALYTKQFGEKAEVVPFITDMLGAYQQASLVVCRSGALTISELIRVQRPAILVPFPRQGQNDQTTNAQLLQDRGVAKVVEQGDQFNQRFESELLKLFQRDAITRLSDRLVAQHSALQGEDALASIASHIEAALAIR